MTTQVLHRFAEAPTMKRLLALLLLTCGPLSSASAYIDYNPTLGDLVVNSKHIMVLQVDKVSKEKGIIVWKKVADIKGKEPNLQIKQQLLDKDRPLPLKYQRDVQAMLDWTDLPGRTAIFFHNGGQAYTCMGKLWYECFAVADNPGWWKLNGPKPTAAYAFTGSPEKLREHVAAMVGGKTVTVTALRWDLNRPYAQMATDFRNLFRGQGADPVWRMKASTQLSGFQQVVDNPANRVGLGGDPADVPALLKALSNPEARLRADAADDLGLIGPAAKAAVPALNAALKDKEPLVRISAAVALVRVDRGQEKPAVTALIDETNAKEEGLRVAAVEALADVGPAARDAVPTLAKLIKDPTGSVQWRAVEALGWTGSETAVPALLAALKENHKDEAAQALMRLGPKAKAAVPELAKLVKDWAGDRAPVEILVAIGPDAKEAAPALAAALKQPNLYYTIVVGQALSRLETPEADKAAVAFLVDVVKKQTEPSYWDLAARWLGDMGPRAKEAVAELRPLAKHPDKGNAVTEALRRIEKKK